MVLIKALNIISKEEKQMALTDESGNGMVMPVAPMYGGGNGGFGFGNDCLRQHRPDPKAEAGSPAETCNQKPECQPKSCAMHFPLHRVPRQERCGTNA